MQWHPFELGPSHYEHLNCESFSPDRLEAPAPRFPHHSTWDFAQRVSGVGDRDALRAFWASDDSQPDPPLRRPFVFRAFSDPILSLALLLAAGRR